ncbi:ricin-type beta-trefoil lectin domain protein [Luteimonas sp. RD2P54]|uniref:Ricin-type beta-trefoil lectin domain protein n=1 Tax=Luteimonas endophytica TaxID=3042023 RepID=A0ABT6J534_9GAMM|nr:ricin-type beta-trefoil lectin domain protein [Luteimonas endophytica]MDH5821884.1 ricin-type beta-trefoil lectin domain protein [Luteimonas endophytica]
MLAALVAAPASALAVEPTIDAYPTSPGGVSVSYAHPGGDGVLNFHLEQQGSGTVRTSANLADTFPVLGLSAATSYDFRVCANYEDSSDCTGFVSVTTMPAPFEPAAPAMDGAPIVTGVGSSGNSVSIAWASRNGPYTRLVLRLEDQLGNVDQRTIDARDGGSFVFPGMRSGATYYLTMKGCSNNWLFGIGGVRCGPWSERREARIAVAPPPSRAQSVSLRNGGGLCLDVHQADMRRNGGRVQAWACNGQDQQRWVFAEGAVRNVGGLCLDVHAPDMRTNGGRMQVWECNGTRQQQWKLSGGRLVGPYGRCLDVHHPDMRDNGARVQIWSCNGAEQQKWQAVR